jgi:type IV secretory pathway TrbD component
VVIGSAAVVALGLAFILWRGLGVWTIELVTTPRRLARLRPKLLEVYDGLAALARPRVLLWSTVLSVAAWACEGLGFALIVEGFPRRVGGRRAGAPDLRRDHDRRRAQLLARRAGRHRGRDDLAPGRQRDRRRSRDRATAATILTRLATLWFAVALGAVALVIARDDAPGRTRRDEAILPP